MVMHSLLRRGRRVPQSKELSEATIAVLHSLDLVSVILEQYAELTRGWSVEFSKVGLVCKVWYNAWKVAEARISEWMTHSWTIKNFSKLTDEGQIFLPSMSSGPYDWELIVLPRLLRFNQEAGEYKSVVGTYLQVPTLPSESEPSEEPPREWARRAVVELTLHHSTSPQLDRHKFFRHLFTPEARDRGYPAEDAAHAFGTPDELRFGGFLVQDTLRLSAKIRVFPGKLMCSTQQAVHPLHRRDALRAHIARAYGECAFFCDVCVLTLPSWRLHSCASGCNFDVCDDCVAAATNEPQAIPWRIKGRRMPPTSLTSDVEAARICLQQPPTPGMA